jgi:23S rRNA (uracil1939-C5)-methyltransferase
VLVDAVERAAAGAPRDVVVDAYGGVGLFAATVLRDAGRIHLVEMSPSSCADARHNLADLDVVLAESTVEQWTPTLAQLVIADPARAGLGAAGVERLAATGAARLVLVSCDPVSAARDTALLVAAGYRHHGSEVLDLFPNTVHMEVVSRFDA